MKPFRISPYLQAQINKKYRRQDRIVSSTVGRIEAIMRGAVEDILSNLEKTGRYKEPNLDELYDVSETFYKTVIRHAYHASEAEKKIQLPKRLAAPGSVGLPTSLSGLEKLFRDKRYWPKVMKRSQKLVDRLRQTYLGKLQVKFSKLLPLIHENELTPAEVKAQLMEAWQATKSRVAVIFRTETTTYYSKTQTAFFEDDSEIIGYLFDSIKDTSRTEWCRSRHGLIYLPGTLLLKQNTPSCHWNCRSHLIPLANTAYNRKLLSDPQRDPTIRKVAPLPPGWR